VQKIYKDLLFEKSRQYGFTGPQIGLIMRLYKNPCLTLNEASKLLGLSKSTVSGIVDRLVAQGVVIREIPEDNRRIIHLSLAPEFSKNNVIKEFKDKFVIDIFENANEEEIEKITSGLEILHRLMKEIYDKENDLGESK
jgi:DNA-binding MarR family transcriptional regulator